MSTVKKRSPIWQYFDISSDNNKYAVCLLCRVQISRGGEGKKAGTTAMSNHLKTKHLEMFKVINEDKAAEVPSPPVADAVPGINNHQFLSAPSTTSGTKEEQEEETEGDGGETLQPVDPLQPTPNLKHSEERPQRIGRRRIVSQAVQQPKVPTDFQPEGDDEFIIFGRHVAAQLKKLSIKESIMAQSKIQSILSESRLNDLTRSEHNSICTVKSNFSSPEARRYSTDSQCSEERMNYGDD